MKRLIYISLFIIMIIPISVKSLNDDLFTNSSKDTSKELILESYDLALSSCESNSDKDITNYYNNNGFSNISTYDLLEDSNINTIGTAIASKKINDYNLIAVSIRGLAYTKEWENNFMIGESGNAKGLSEASIKVIDRIKEYISTNNLTNNKIWISGYSRGGGIGSLVGIYINNNLEEFSTKEDNLYIYTIESPNPNIDDIKFDNIYHIVNENDLITKLYPENWGFKPIGKIINIGEKESIKTYHGLLSNNEYNEVLLSDYLDEFINFISSRITREEYVKYLQEPLCNYIDIYYDKSDEERKEIEDFLINSIINQVMDNKDDLLLKVQKVTERNSDYLYEDLANSIKNILIEKKKDNKKLTDYEYQVIINTIYPVIRSLGPLLVDDLNYYNGKPYDYYLINNKDYQLSDFEYGQKKGNELGTKHGYEDGFFGRQSKPFINTNENGLEYSKGFKEGYSISYSEFYKIGSNNRTNPKEKALYDGERKGYEKGYSDGKLSSPKKTTIRTIKENEIFTDKYISNNDNIDKKEYMETYNNCYKEAYKEYYEKGYSDGEKDQNDIDESNKLSMYHIRTFINNIETITKNHFPNINLDIIKNIDNIVINNNINRTISYNSIYILTAILVIICIIVRKKVHKNK